ncbi:MAG: heme NO-binding domain-containing protein [Pseudomonadota bacterium]
MVIKHGSDMKGIVFRELVDMIEERFSPAIADKIISASSLATNGAYTSVGTYDHKEIVELVGHLSTTTGIPVPDLQRTFGEHLLNRFALLYPAHFRGQKSTFAFLAILDNKIHVEVKKLYPDAELPVFEHDLADPCKMVFVYRSKRPFADLAEGLIRGCIKHFNEDITLSRQDLPADEGAHTRFILIKN